jgi:hypothetical protein
MTKSKMQAKVAKVAKEFSKGELHSGSKHGPLVKSKVQALAIGYSEGRKASRRGKK